MNYQKKMGFKEFVVAQSCLLEDKSQLVYVRDLTLVRMGEVRKKDRKKIMCV